MTYRPLQGFLLSMVTAILWGALPLFLKLSLLQLDASTITFFRFFFAFSFVFLVLALKKELPVKRQFNNKTTWLVVFAGVGLTANYVTNVIGLELIDPESAQVLIQLAPFLLMIGGVVLFNEPFSKVQKAGATVLLLGFLLFFKDNLQTLFSGLGQYTLGVLVMLVAAITWVAYALAQKWLLNIFTARQLTMMIYLFGAILLIPLSDISAVFSISWLTAGALLFCCLNTLIAYGSFAKAMSIWQASKVSAVIALAPIFTILSMTYAVLWFPEYFQSSELTKTAYAGAFLVVIGSMLTALGRSEKVK